ncbi:hypothetical protein ABR737_37900 [Streptomyces sp. Edi2]|uniref:hypothetical protein n=1 Tax=Streptomyces sp. Edi2 TaxID=3162528 RepID=UPI0033067F2B
MPVEGTRDLDISTPIGKIEAVTELRSADDGSPAGTPRAGRQPVSKVTGRRRSH